MKELCFGSAALMIYLFRKGDAFNKYIDDAKEYVGESSKQDS